MLISSPLRRRHWHNRSCKMSTSGGKRHRSCRIQQHNVRMKCFIWIVAWLCTAVSHTVANHSLALPTAQTSLLSTSASLNLTSVPFSRGTLHSSAECGVNEFQCKSDHLCIPLTRVADGTRDCPDGSDECDIASQFRCKCGSPVCIERTLVMDGQIHCEDGSDEGLDSAGTGCMSNELSAGLATFSDENVRENENFVDTGQAAKIEASKSSAADFIEFTGTFVSFDDITATNRAPYQYFQSASDTSTSEPVIEITGTFIPEQTTSTAVVAMASESSLETQPTTEAMPSSQTDDQTDGLGTLVRGTNQTFVVEGQSITLITGQSSPSMTDGFIFACAKVRNSSPLIRSMACSEVPIEISMQREVNQSSHSRNVMLVDVFPNKVLLKTFFPPTEHSSNRIKPVNAKFGRLTVPGVLVQGVEKIEVNKESHQVPVAVKDYVEFKIDASPKMSSHFNFIDRRNESVEISESTSHVLMSALQPSSSSMFQPEPSQVQSNKNAMRTKTVGHLSSIGPSAITKSLQSYFSNRNIPTYSPTKLEPSPLTRVFTEPEATSQVSQIRNTSTIFGFIDFTTVVNNTLLIFTPKSKVESSSSSKIPRIEPTRAAIFKNLITSTSSIKSSEDMSSEMTSSVEASQLSSAMETVTEETSSLITELSSSMIEPSVAVSFEPEIDMTSELPEMEELNVETNQDSIEVPRSTLSSISGVTITSGFILPSFSTHELVRSSQSPLDVSTESSSKLSATTLMTRFTEYLTEEDNGQTVTKINTVTSSNVLYGTENLKPSKPLKTFYTTYTYYTTFRDDQTEFVHSRKEIVTNLVDASEAEISINVTPSRMESSVHSQTSTLIDMASLLSTSSPSLDKMDVELSATPSLVDFELRSSVSSKVPETVVPSTDSIGSLNKSYLGKLLSGIAVPITHYTTYTYYTTFFKDMTSQIVSRTKVVSNVVTGTINLNQAIQKRSTEYSSNPQDIIPEGAENLPIVITPVTEYATSTYFTTFFVPGQGSTVVTNTQIVSKVCLPEFSEVTRHRQTSRQLSTSKPSLGHLSAASKVTRLINGVPILENGDIALPVTETAKSAPLSEEAEVELIKPTSTRKRLVVTRTKTLPNAHSLNGLPRKSTVIVRGPPKSQTEPLLSSVAREDPHQHQLGRLHPLITPSPVTYYTTYTYFTTQLVNGKPMVLSNEHLFSTVITGKVLPTRVVPTLHPRVRRTAVMESSMTTQELSESFMDSNSEEIVDNKIELGKSEKGTNKPTGVLSELTSKSGLHTVVTQIIGTLINGFYAQFAVTKTLEPIKMLATVKSVESNNLVDEVTTESSEVDVQTESEVTSTPAETTTEFITQSELSTQSDLLISEITEANDFLSIPQNETFVATREENFTESAPDNSTQAGSIVLSLAIQTETSTETSMLSSVNSTVNSSPLSRVNVSLSESEIIASPKNSIESTENSIESSLLLPTLVSIRQTPTLPTLETSTSETVNIDYRTGLISSLVESITGGNRVTRITREVFGTYIAGIYAHLAKTRSDTIELTPEPQTAISTSFTSTQSPPAPSSAPTAFSSVLTESTLAPSNANLTLASSPLTLSVSISATSPWANQSPVSVSPSVSPIESNLSQPDSSLVEASFSEPSNELVEPTATWLPLPGLSTVSISTETVNQTVLVHTTEYYTTEINGFTAHYSRSTSSMAGTVESTSTSTSSRPSIHFPTPVRFLFSTKFPSTTTVYVTNLADFKDQAKFARKYKELYGNEHDYYDEPFTPTGGHLPRSRIIREKDSQPIVEYEYDLDYADNSEHSNRPEAPKPTPSFTNEYMSTVNYANQRAQQGRANSFGYSPRRSAGFGQRVKSGGNQEPNQMPMQNYRSNEENIQPLPRGRQNNGRPATGLSNRRRQIVRTSTVVPSRSLDQYNLNDYASTRAAFNMNEVGQESKSSSSDVYSRTVSRNGANMQSDQRRPLNRHTGNRRRQYSTTTSTTTTTTTTPAPRNYALLPNQRLRLNRKYNHRNRSPDSPNIVRMQTVDHDLNRERSEVHKERVRYRGPSKPAGLRAFGQTMKPIVPKETYVVPRLSFEMAQVSTVYATPTIPKVPLTVTSIVTTVKTVPIFHGFRTSYATLTTTTLNTSVIPQSLYETSVNEEGMTKTLFTKITDSAEPNKVTEILVTTSALQEVKLVPIRFGYSTRTETITDVKTFTMLTTIVNTRNQEIQLPPPGSSLLTTVSTYVTTQTLSSTTAVSLLLHGKTLVSTLTFTSVTESTVTKTETLTVAATQASQIQPQPIVTMLTISITGDNGEVTELVTALTVPVQQMLHTKVERDVKATSSFVLDERRHRPRHRHIALESSTSPVHNNYLSASFKTVEQYSETHPFFITTIFKGPNTEIYEARATKMANDNDNSFEERPTVFRKRKLQQFNDNLYKEPSVLLPDNTFNNERTKPIAGQTQRKPSFQRIRIKQVKPNTRPEQKSPNESRLNEFNRLVGIPEGSFPGPFAVSSSATSFRRVPISREPQHNLYSNPPTAVSPAPSSSSSYLLANNFQKPTFRKIKPQLGANQRRIVSSIRTVHPIIVSSVIQPNQVFASRLVHNSNFLEISKAIPSPVRPYSHLPANFHSQAGHLQAESQNIRPDHRPVLNVPSRNRFNSIDADDIFDVNRPKHEFSDNNIGNLGLSNSMHDYSTSLAQVDPSVHTPTIPLTYYTTFTYLTTVIRGPHTAHLSRESVTSTVTTKPLDKSIVEVVRDNDGIIEPTKVLQLGIKTKGVTTTVYNEVSQVQIYNEDLYNVIQKTYNKNIQFKPWQSSSTYQPVFVTNHMGPSRETSLVWSHEFDVVTPIVHPSHVINDVPNSSGVTEESNLAFNTPSALLFSPVLTSSMESTSEAAASVMPTPTIENTLSSSTVSSRPLRISSSVLVRKPMNSKYGYLYSRSRVRVRVKGTSQNSNPSTNLIPTQTETPSVSSVSSEESFDADITPHLDSSVVSRPNRIKTTKSKIIIRPRNQSNSVPLMSTLNSNVFRVSSRIMKPTASLDMFTFSPTDLPAISSNVESSLEPELSTHSETPHLDSIAHSDAARANKFTRVSNGVTLIISSKVASRPFTLEPTLVTGAAVLMKHIDTSETSMDELSSPVLPRKQYTTFTYHTTFLQGDKTFVSSSEATVTNSIRPSLSDISSIQPSTTTETMQIYRTSTLYSTLTYYATLFNGSASSVTPIEDVKTEYITYPDSTVVTRTIDPSKSLQDVITQTHYTTYTNLATIFSNSKPMVSTLQEVMSSEVVLPNSQSNYFAMASNTVQSPMDFKPAITTTRSTHTTLTHFITLFSGTHTILSSIEEISPTVVTEIVGQPSAIQTTDKINMHNIRFTQPSYDIAKQSKNLFGGLVPSVSTLSTTHTYYTTLFSGTTSIIQSREETTHSLVTLYVPSSVVQQSTIKPSAQLDIATSIEPSLRIESSSIGPSTSYVPDFVESSLELHPSAAMVENYPSSTPSLDDDTELVFFTNFILPSSVHVSENTIEQAKGPVNGISSLLNHGQLSVLPEIIKPDQVTRPGQAPIVPASDVISNEGQNNTIKPGAIIELSDLLDGANLAGNIGEAIKDIVQILSKGQKNKQPIPDGIDRTSAVQEMPPKEGATVSHLDDPVYIPMNPIHQVSDNTMHQATPSLEMPPVVYVSSQSEQSSSIRISHDLSSPILPTLVFKSHSPTTTSLVSTAQSSFISPDVRSISSIEATQREIAFQESTRYITSVEATPSTVHLTTTKVYYTRDAPLTITSEYISTLAPKTIITTVAGSKTIINTYSSEIKPTTSQTLPAITAVHSVNVQSKPESGRPFKPTRRPGVNRFKPPSRPTDAPKIFKTSHRPRVPFKPSPTPPAEVLFDGNSKNSFKKSTKIFLPKTTTRPSILDLDQCKPGCNAANKEICKEFDGKFKCDCRPGYTKKPSSDTCHELQNFIVLVRVTKLGESEIVWQSDLLNRTSEQYLNLAKASQAQLDNVQIMEGLKDNYIGSDVMSIEQAVDGNGVLVNMTIHLTESGNLDQDLLKEKLARTLEKSSELLPSPQQIYADLEDLIDFDECSSEQYNDCAFSARCINEPGSYRCECLNGYPDLDISLPGRMCASEIKACEFCNGHGDCFRDETGQISSCKCYRMYLGRRCDINGLLLAIFIPVLAILCIVSICSIVYCCRKWKNRALTKGFRNFSAYGPNMIGNTLDRKAMLETSSDNSDPLRSHISYDGPGMTSAEATLPRDYRRRRESDHSSDRSLGSLQAATAAQYNFSPQFMIPRVRNTTQTPASANSHYSHHQHYGRGHRHSHYNGNGHNHGHSHSHNPNQSHGHSHHSHHHNHNHHSSSYDLQHNDQHGNNQGHNHRGHSYMW